MGAIFKAVLSALAVLITFLWGGGSIWIYSLITVIIIDYITGIIAAVINKELSSKTGLNGILKKVLYFAVVAVAQMVDRAVGGGLAVRDMVIIVLAANEGISILENCARAGLSFIPPKLKDMLKQLRGDDNTN